MSMWCDDVELVRAAQVVRRKARKPRDCQACKDTIRKGDQYEVMSGIDGGGTPFRYWRCLRCAYIYYEIEQLLPFDEACAWLLDCGHSWKERFKTDPPEHLVEVVLMAPDEVQGLTLETRLGRFTV